MQLLKSGSFRCLLTKSANCVSYIYFLFFFQAEDGIRDLIVTGVQTCALPISRPPSQRNASDQVGLTPKAGALAMKSGTKSPTKSPVKGGSKPRPGTRRAEKFQIGRASCRERV